MVKNLGEILLEQGIIGRDALDRALQIQSRRLGEILIEESLADPVAIAQALKFQALSKTGRRSSRLMVEVVTLEEILARIESIEDQIADQLANEVSSGSGRAVSFLSSLVSLRQSMEMLLLEPVETLFSRARLIAGQASGDAGKKVELTCEGGGLVIDRALIDELSDIVLHLVRNSIDHGIESGADRRKLGKSPVGAIRLGVSTFGGRIVLTLSDDGRGIDDEAVYRKALEKGLLEGNSAKPASEVLHRLLFTPGFSTADKLTNFSGRGVGLDVVEATAIRLSGDVTVRSSPGHGVTFRISVPLHCARLAVVPLRVGKEWIAVNASEITSIERTSDLTGLLSAASLFPGDGPQPALKPPFLRVECLTGSRWAFDEVGQPEDVMVREASAFAKGAHGVIGGARMRDGRSVLLIDMNLLATLATPVT